MLHAEFVDVWHKINRTFAQSVLYISYFLPVHEDQNSFEFQIQSK